MGDQPGTCAAAAYAARFPEADLRPAGDRRRRDDTDSRAMRRGGAIPAWLMPPDRLPSRLPSTVRRFPLAYDALVGSFASVLSPITSEGRKRFARAGCACDNPGDTSSHTFYFCLNIVVFPAARHKVYIN